VAWPVAFGHILPEAFLDHELKRVYSDQSLESLMAEGERFFLRVAGDEIVGFASLKVDVADDTGKLEKLYLKPQCKGQGHGKALLLHVIDEATQAECRSLSLNVNRSNPAIQFYESLGFQIIREEDIVVGSSFTRNDYVMQRGLV
jgi:diamine N-acetyltransferase